MKRGNEVAAAVPRDAELGSGRREKKREKERRGKRAVNGHRLG